MLQRCMPLMKIGLSIITCILTLFVYGQETNNFNITLTNWQSDSRLPNTLDTIFLNKSLNKTGKIYTNVTSHDTSFVLPEIPIGKYWLQFSTKNFNILPISIVVCSRCDNNFLMFASLKESSNDNVAFQMIEVSPSYIGDKKALSKDFKYSLSKGEKKKIKQSKNFVVHFYLTKENIISDPSFMPSNLSKEIKEIVIKGLMNVTNWRPALRNGRIVDVEFKLNKATLMND